jgi:hypothetical protein
MGLRRNGVCCAGRGNPLCYVVIRLIDRLFVFLGRSFQCRSATALIPVSIAGLIIFFELVNAAGKQIKAVGANWRLPINSI